MHYNREGRFESFYVGCKLCACHPTQHVIRHDEAHRSLAAHSQGFFRSFGLKNRESITLKDDLQPVALRIVVFDVEDERSAAWCPNHNSPIFFCSPG